MRGSLVLVAMLMGCGDNGAPSADAAFDGERVLVYTRTLGYRHADAIDVGPLAVRMMLTGRGFATDITEDPAAFTTVNLARYRGVLFMYTSGNDILDEAGKAALEGYVRGGGGWMGLHSATDTEYEWPFYQEMIVAHFLQHPMIQPARMHVEALAHPAMAGVPSEWDATDEWYDFASNVRATTGVEVLATIDEASYTGGTMGSDHPMIWAHSRFGGRVLYVEPGHLPERWTEPAFMRLVDNSLRWVMHRD